MRSNKSRGRVAFLMNRKRVYSVVLPFGLTSLLSDLSHEMATAVLPLFLSATLGAAPLALGLIEGVSDLLSSSSKAWAGWYSDKIGRRKPFLVIGYLLTGLLVPAIGLVRNWLDVLFLRTAGWVGRGVRSPPRDALMASQVPRSKWGEAFGVERMLDTIGAVLGPAVAFVALPLIGVRNVFFLSVLPGIAAILVVVFLVKEKRTAHKRNADGFFQSLRNLPPSFKAFLVPVALFGVANFANTFLVLRAAEALTPVLGALAAGATAAGMYVVLNLGAAVFAYVFGRLADRMPKRDLLALGYVLFALYCIGFIVLPPSVLNFALLFALAGCETGLIDVLERAYASELVHGRVRATALGAMNAVNGVGDFVSSVLAGLFWTFWGFAAAFAYGAVLALGAALLLMSKPVARREK